MPLPYQLGPPIGAAARFGLIALSTDETIEAELGPLLGGAQTALLTTRVPAAAEVTPDNLATMAEALPRAAGLLPGLPYDVIGYGCTSGATTIGPDAVARLIRTCAKAEAVTDPLTATIAACHALDSRRIALVTPYVPAVSEALIAALEKAEITIAAHGSFEILQDAAVARVEPASILNAVLEIGSQGGETVFISCTNLRALSIIAEAEAALGKPVFSSNLALGWHMLSLAHRPPPHPGPGALLRRRPAALPGSAAS